MHCEEQFAECSYDREKYNVVLIFHGYEVALKTPVINNSFVDNILSRIRSTAIGRIFEDSTVVMVTQLFAMAMVFLYSVVTASWFGAGAEMDAFVMASTVPNYIINLVTSGVAAAMIPAFIAAIKNEGHESAQKLFSNLSTLLIASLVMIGIISILSGKYLLSLICIGFDTQTLTLTANLYYILIPSMIVTGLTVQWSATLNALNSFAMPGIARGVQSLFAVVSVWLVGSILGIYVLPFGVLFGAVINLAILGLCLAKKDISLLPSWSGLSTRTRQTLRQYLSMFIGAAFLGSTLLVDQVMASSMGPGSVAALNYGNTLALAFQSLISMALSTAILPHFSVLSSDGNINELRHTLGFYILVMLIVTVPITLATFHWSDDIVRIVYQRGVFTEDDTQMVSSVQRMAVLQVPFYLMGITGAGFLSSTFQNQLLMKINLFTTAAKIGLNFLLMPRLGLPGLALATSCMYILSCVLILYATYSWIRRRVK